MTCGERLIDPTTGKALRDPTTGKVLRNPCAQQCALLYVASGLDLNTPYGCTYVGPSSAQVYVPTGFNTAIQVIPGLFYETGTQPTFNYLTTNGFNLLFVGTAAISLPSGSMNSAGLLPGTYSNGYQSVTASVPSTSPYSTSVPTSVSISVPVTQVRTASGAAAVNSSSVNPWNGVLAVQYLTCDGMVFGSGGYNKLSAISSSPASFDGYGINSVTFLAGAVGTNGTSNNSSGSYACLEFSVPVGSANYTARYFSNNYSYTGTLTAEDPLTVPQTITVT